MAMPDPPPIGHPVRLAIVGTGKVARKSYLPHLSGLSGVVLSYYSRTRAKADACAADFGGRVAPSLEELLADDPDAILVLTHETQRLEAARALLDLRPRRLFFEKPLVARNGQANVYEEDFLDARSLLRSAEAAGSETAMVFNYRFFDQTVRARRIIVDREFGKLTQASLFVNYACWSHCIDLLHLFGGPAERVAAIAGKVPHQNAVDLAGSFLLSGGASGVILGTSGSRFESPLYDVRLTFERGTLRFTDLDGPLEVFEAGSRYVESSALIGHHSRWDQYQASFGKSLDAYIASIRRNEPPPVPGRAGLEELQFEAALRRAAAQGRAVDVQEEFPLDG